MKPRPCGCKGARTCLICETKYGANDFKPLIELDKSKGYVYCPFCDLAWPGWDAELYKKHPNHTGQPIKYPGIYIKLDFISKDEENELMKHIDEMPWDISQSGRRKQNFGPKTNFKKRKIVAGKFNGFPQFSKYLQERFNSIDLLKGYHVIEQCSLEYDPIKGASIDPHIDDCWVWGERILTLNCLTDTVLTMTPFKGDTKKYNLSCAEEYPPIIKEDGSLNLQLQACSQSMFEACRPLSQLDVIVRIPMIRRSLALMYGEPRYHWEHCILREDILARRVCIAYREFTPLYLTNGQHKCIGDNIRSKAEQFWDHRCISEQEL
ncbi:alpha-ketoglutarate-dependent dioxygenase alkB homolog 4 [Pieris brassicae]|uniref:alpha-ketoglutarate-dependent dioxygenase alkB homolog 4 n=1 Tax=Pieris brassicae TaxID=7116 RepID=UPI001E661FFE|nr:alpha-ketoglutarate-dependent dioxygenase alkB homolog 4 [Pieris brassicae]